MPKELTPTVSNLEYNKRALDAMGKGMEGVGNTSMGQPRTDEEVGQSNGFRNL
jgi:hypothetical protein